jgi:2-dehydro-3-deoxyphosphooctonate aldolase (KDO 8-P synthase)
VLKSSFDKANRTSGTSYRGPGLYKGLEILQAIKNRFGLRLLTDIHENWQAEEVAKVVDVIQIPALLIRQTDLIQAAARTGKALNFKKGQFMAPEQMAEAIKKAQQVNPDAEIYLTERGTFFGYGDLVVDFRSIPRMRALGAPVLFDAGHSVQRPGALASGGDRHYIPVLARAGVAAGADGLFIEVHPDPDQALSDGPNMLPLADLANLTQTCLMIRRLVTGDTVLPDTLA